MSALMEGGLNRYHQLGLHDSLTIFRHYPSSCAQLALILNLSYSKSPKILQSQIFQDLLTAFRLLPTMQTHNAVLSANTLLQSAESALPKQKKAQAVTLFKHAIIAHKRYSKSLHIHKDLVELPQDILVHVFSFLDLQSLLSASQVSRSWNAASTDSHLWQLMYRMFINTSHNFSNTIKLFGELGVDHNSLRFQEGDVCDSSPDWRAIFKKAYKDFSLKKLFTSSRGFCKHCHEIVWVSDMDFGTISGLKCKYHHIKPISSRQIAEYIDGNFTSLNSDSDSESDSDEESVSKLWAYPKRKGFSFGGNVRGRVLNI